LCTAPLSLVKWHLINYYDDDDDSVWGRHGIDRQGTFTVQCKSLFEGVSSFLTAHQHIKGLCGRKGTQNHRVSISCSV